MKITETADLDGSVETVFRLLATLSFQQEKCARTNPLRHTAQVQADGERTIIRTMRAMPTTGFPDAARRVVGGELVVEETQDWGPPGPGGERIAGLQIRVREAPLTLIGELRLDPVGTGSRQQLTGELRAAVPLVGGKIERHAALAVTRGFEIESALAADWLAAAR